MKEILLQIDIKNFWVVNWYYIVAVFVSITSALIGYKNYKKKSTPNVEAPKDESNIIGNTTSSEINPVNTNNITLNMGHPIEPIKPIEDAKSYKSSIEDLKKIINILFIDDDTKFRVVKVLTNEGWKNTKSIIDLNSYNDDKIKNANIVFVDIQGVGKILECKDEGLGLALNIKTKYPEKKVIIYSAIQSHKVFHEAIQKVDFLLSKDAEPYEFISLVERFSLEL